MNTDQRLTKPYKEHLRETLKTIDDYRGYLDACHVEGPETFALAVQDVLDLAATRMREACAAALRELVKSNVNTAAEAYFNDGVTAALKAVESLALDQVEEKQ